MDNGLKKFFLLLAAGCLLLVSGCGYTLQTSADLPFDTIYIGRIDNKTHEPKLQDDFNRVLAETLSEYGFKINQSRYVLEGVLTNFTLTPTAEQASIAVQYEVIIQGNFRLVDKVSNKTFPLTASSPFITYFSSSGRLENVLAERDLVTLDALKNLSQVLAQQITYGISSSFASLLLGVSDIKDAGSLALKLQEHRDPLSRYIREQFTRDSLQLIDEYDKFEGPSDQLKNVLVAGLNQIIQKPALYNKKRFEGIALSDKAKEMIRRKPKGEDLIRLNRMLLEEAYPEAFGKTKKAAE